MPKLKTSKTASKRITKVTKNGKFMRLQMDAQHLARRKSKRARKNAASKQQISAVDVKKLKKLLPYR